MLLADVLSGSRPYVVCIDVSIGLQLVVMQVKLCFGPFHRLEEAQQWVGDINRFDILEQGDQGWDEILMKAGLPSQDFIRFEIDEIHIIQPDEMNRNLPPLLAIDTPEIASRDIYFHAIAALQKANGVAFLFMVNAPP